MVASPSSQMQHGVMISIMLHTMTMVFSGADPKTIPELWQTSWTLRRQRLQQNRQDGEGNDDGDGEPKPKVSLGLGFSDAIKQHGIIWLDPSMILWESLPCFKPELLPQLPLTCSHLQQNMQINHNISATMIKQDQTQKLFREYVQDVMKGLDTQKKLWWGHLRNEPIFMAGAQMIVQQYIQEVFVILHKQYMLDVMPYVMPQDCAAVLWLWKTRLPPVIYEG